MNPALVSLLLPFATSLILIILRSARWSPWLALAATTGSFASAAVALHSVTDTGTQMLVLGGWPEGLGIRLRASPLAVLLVGFTALVHLLVGLYAAFARSKLTQDFWPLACLLHAGITALLLSADLFNIYVTLELLSLTAVAMVTLAGPKAYSAALRYLVLSLAASLCYLLGVALIYSHYGVLDLTMLSTLTENDRLTQLAVMLLTVGLMLKGALWPLHLWLPPAHAGAPTAVSALLSALVVKAPLFVLWTVWSELATPELGTRAGPLFALAGILALVSGGWSALRAPYLKTLVAYSTVAQLGYALLALGLMLYWQQPRLHVALWFFVLAHGLAKVSMFLAAGELQSALGSRRVTALRGATQTAPVAMFAFAVAGGSLIGLPPSGGFLAKWVLLEPMFTQPQHWPWALGILLGTVVSAAYVFRVVALGFSQVPGARAATQRDRLAEWLAMVPALLVWGMALVGETLINWLGGVT